jgi:hypothetical protein
MEYFQPWRTWRVWRPWKLLAAVEDVERMEDVERPTTDDRLPPQAGNRVAVGSAPERIE